MIGKLHWAHLLAQAHMFGPPAPAQMINFAVMNPAFIVLLPAITVNPVVVSNRFAVTRQVEASETVGDGLALSTIEIEQGVVGINKNCIEAHCLNYPKKSKAHCTFSSE